MADTRSSRRARRRIAARSASGGDPGKLSPRSAKATGWRVPLLFCAGIIVFAALFWGWRRLSAPPPLPIEAELLTLAGQSRLNLDADPEGRRYKDALISAGRGLDPTYIKDAKAAAIAEEALDAGRIDAGVTAIQVIRDVDRRDMLLRRLAAEAMADCRTLPWAVFAARNLIHDYPVAMGLTRKINERWEVCRRQHPGGLPAYDPVALAAEREEAMRAEDGDAPEEPASGPAPGAPAPDQTGPAPTPAGK